MVWLFRFRDKKQMFVFSTGSHPSKKDFKFTNSSNKQFPCTIRDRKRMATGLNISNRILGQNLFLKHDNRFWWFYQEVFLSGQLGICHAPKKIYQRSGKSPCSPDRKIWILQCLGFFFSVLSPFICLPRTQMTLVSIGKGLVSGGLTFKNRGHWGSR